MGEWEAEPDRVAFEASGFKCVILRHPSFGHLCGYIAAPKFAEDGGPYVHGEWTYSEDHLPNMKCDGLWWNGFDCAHAGDFLPKSANRSIGIYRNIVFVRTELERVAAELAAQSDGS